MIVSRKPESPRFAAGAALGRVHQGVVRLGGADRRSAQGVHERGEVGLYCLRVGVVGDHALGFHEAADS
jgi:hypothetical protein